MSTFALLFYIFTGALSLSYMVFGKKQENAIAFVSGLGLGVVPYFGLAMWQMVLLALGFIVLPFVLKVWLFGILPLLYTTGVGSEIQYPLSVVVTGGIISSTILTLLVLPGLYVLFFKENNRSLINGEY